MIGATSENKKGRKLKMEETVKRLLEKGGDSPPETETERLFEKLVMKGVKVEVVQPGRLICSFSVPDRLLNAGNFLHGGATATLVDLVGSAVIYTLGAPMTGVSVEINVSYLDAAFPGEEIEVEAKALRVGKAIGVVSVELRKKKTGKIVAQGRHTKYLALSSKI